MTLEKCAVLRIGMLTEVPLCMEGHPMCRLKNPTVAFIVQNRCVQCTPAHYRREILRIGTWTRGSLCRESHPLCRLKNPTVVYMITSRLSSCKTSVYNNVHLLIILERGCSSMHRKKESSIRRNYAKQAVTSFFKSYPCENYNSRWLKWASLTSSCEQVFLRTSMRPGHAKMCLMSYANNSDADKPSTFVFLLLR